MGQFIGELHSAEINHSESELLIQTRKSEQVRTMRFNPNRTVAMSTCLMAFLLLAMTGCKSGMFKKPDLSGLKGPDFSSLAFWKKDQSEVPPPPAHHFEPAPASGQVAGSKSSDIQSKFSEMARSARMQKEENMAEPIRKPYSLGSVDGSELNNRNSFDTEDNAKAVSYVPELDATVEQAQQDFNSAVANTKQAVDNTATTAADTASKWKNDFALPGKISESQSTAANLRNNFSAQLDDANRRLNGFVANATTSAAEPKIMDQTLQPNLTDSLTTVKNEFVNQSVGMAKQAASAIETGASQGLGNVQAEVALAQQQIAELRRQVAEAKQQALELANGSVKQATQIVSQPLDHVAKLHLPGVNPSSTSHSQLQPNFSQSPSTTSPNTASQNFSPLDNANPANGGYPNNVLRSNSFAPTTGPGNGRLQPQSSSEQPTGQYPSTPHSSYSSQGLSNHSPNQFGVQPVSAQQTGNTK